VPLAAEGPKNHHIVAFARVLGDEAAITLACRLPLSMLADAEASDQAEFWGDTVVSLPADLAGLTWRDVLSERALPVQGSIPVRDLLVGQTVALLMTGGEH
jgi:(1->4)-alpha-D-glucan 1-alpha-D-glucosylmutase